MPTRKDGAENTEKIIIRWSKNLKDRCELARLAGAHTSDADMKGRFYLWNNRRMSQSVLMRQQQIAVKMIKKLAIF